MPLCHLPGKQGDICRGNRLFSRDDHIFGIMYILKPPRWNASAELGRRVPFVAPGRSAKQVHDAAPTSYKAYLDVFDVPHIAL